MKLHLINFADSPYKSCRLNPFDLEKDSNGKYLVNDENLTCLAGALGYIWNQDLDQPEPSKGQTSITVDLLKVYYEHINATNGRPSWPDFNRYHNLEDIFTV